MRKYSNMLIRLLLQYKHNEEERNYWLNAHNCRRLEENNRICIYGCLSAIYTFG